jgi:hypothetical protein
MKAVHDARFNAIDPLNDEDLATAISRNAPLRMNVPWNVAVVVTNASAVILQAPLTITTDRAIDEEERDPLSTQMITIVGKKVVADKDLHLMDDDLLPPFDRDIATVDEIRTMIMIAIDDDDNGLWDLNRHLDVLVEDGEEGVHEGGLMQVVALRLIPRDVLL